MIGNVVGMLTVVSEVEKRPGSGIRRFECICECGNTTHVDAGNLKKKTTRSCGCLRLSQKRDAMTKHGVRFHPAYSRWNAMRARCYLEYHPGYKNYGARGIKVCDEWRDDPSAFVKWADESGFRKDLQLDRRDNDGDYTPENCRWVTRSVNNRNRRPFNRGGK